MTEMTTVPENYNNIHTGIIELLKTAWSATQTSEEGQYSVVPCWLLCQIRLGCYREVAYATGCAIDVYPQCREEPESEVIDPGR